MNITVTTTALMAASILSALTLTLVPMAPCRPGAGLSQASGPVSDPGLHTAMATQAALGRAMGEVATQVAGPASVQAWAWVPTGDAASACRPASAPSWT